MAVRQVYSCDWCCVDSPRGDEIPNDWQARNTPDRQERIILCAVCHKAACEAWEAARAKRFRDTHPLPKAES